MAKAHRPARGLHPSAAARPLPWESVAALVRAGRFTEAEAAARVRVVAQPRDTASLSLLARLCLQNGRNDDAVAFAERLVALAPADQGVLVLAGRALRAAGRQDEAAQHYRAAVGHAPALVEAWTGLGLALRSSEPAAARDALLRACELAPQDVQARLNLANVLLDLNELAEAETALRRILELDPQSEDALLRLGAVLTRCGRTPEARECLRRVLQANPLNAEAAGRLAMLEAAAGNVDSAIALAVEAARLAPRDAACLAFAGDALRLCGNLEEAIVIYRRCLEADPDHLLVLNNLANVLCTAGQLTEAEVLARRAVELAPGFADGAATLARAVSLAGRSSEAQSILDVAAGQPGVSLAVLQTTLMNLNAVEGLDVAATVARHRACMARVGFPAPVSSLLLTRGPEAAGERLRVGYLSPDFRTHSVAYFVEALLRGHDRRVVEVFCYSLVPHPDDTTQRLRALGHRWVECAWLDDDALAERIRADGIQVLVDLAGHTAGGRLGVMAARVAPVQCTWLGYPTATGLSEIDWRITDAVVDPIGEPWEGSERPLRVAPSYYCYAPPRLAPEPSDVAARSDGRVVFASFNSLAKLGEATLQLWSAVLSAVPDALLLVKAKGIGDPRTDSGLLARLEAAGVDRDRVALRGYEHSAEHHLAAFHQADVLLDATPYNGATTTCEALWMGVPVVTLVGATHAGRMGASILGAAGLGGWVARDIHEYVDIAAGLAASAASPGRRAELRQRVATSPLTDGRAFAASMEAAYRKAWAASAEEHKLPRT